MISLRRFLYPGFPLRELPGMFLLMVAGAVGAGLYGVIHDQVTYTLSPEYFTRLKFDQFAYARPGDSPPRVFAGIIGFLATWWVGGLVAWILARVALFNESRLPPIREMAGAIVIVFAVAMLSGGGGWLWGCWRMRTGYDASWLSFMDSLGVESREAFMTVCYIHNASYLGGMLGTLVAIVALAKARRRRTGRVAPEGSD